MKKKSVHETAFARILALFSLLALSFLLPWWAWLILGIAFAFMFPYFIEFVVVALIYESIVAIETPILFDLSFFLSIFAAVAIIVIEILKTRLLFYHGR